MPLEDFDSIYAILDGVEMSDAQASALANHLAKIEVEYNQQQRTPIGFRK